MFKRNRNDIAAVIVILIGALLRIYNYSDWSLSNDELSAMSRLQFQSFSEMIEKGVRLNDMHPMGVQSFLWVWTHFAGLSEAAFRLPFVLLGIGALIVFYKLVCHWFNKTAALFSVCLIAILQFPILFSQLARPYSPGLFFSLLFVFAWTKLLFETPSISMLNNKKWRWYIIFIFSGLACMYIHYFSFLFAGIVGITGLFYIKKENIKGYLLAGVLMFVLYLPNLKVFLFQVGVGGLGGEGGWLGAPDKMAIFNYIFYSLNNSYLVVGLCIAILLSSILLLKPKIKWTVYHNFCLLFFLLPALIAYFYSIFKNPVFQYSILLFSFPFLLIFICSFIPNLNFNLKTIGSLIVAVIILMYSTIYEQKFYSIEKFADFKMVATKANEINLKFSSENVLNTMNVISPFYINYYLNAFKLSKKIESYQFESSPELKYLNKLASKATKKYFLHGWANTFHAPEIDQIIQQYYPFIIERDSFFNSGLTLYSKTKVEGAIFNKTVLFEEFNSFEIPRWLSDSTLSLKGNAHTGNFSTRLDENVEFGAGFSAKINNIKANKNNTIQISCWVYGYEELKNSMLVFSISRGDSSVIWRSTSLVDYANGEKEWSQVFMAYTITEEIEPNDELKVYLWNPSKGKFIADDFSIKIVE